ncbi:MAG: alpha/beta hydrolase [Saprospirales bacterium]|nr:MAG: alpha/beta hydrolase [Saprospirales bacterium]
MMVHLKIINIPFDFSLRNALCSKLSGGLFILFLSLASLQAQDRGRVYTPDDFLRSGYFKYSIDLGELRREGNISATLISKRPRRPGNQAVLYIHGYLDYFFQQEMGEKFVQSGYTFYALDLRRHGRSWQEGQILSYSRDMREYFEEIELALEIIADEGHEQIVLMGHSTGGLISALFMNESSASTKIDLLVLNSPFLAFNFGDKNGKLALGFARMAGFIAPRRELGPPLSPLYGMSIHLSHHGEWNFDTIVKPIQAPRAKAGWIRAVSRSQRQLTRKSDIGIPTLILHSDRSVYSDEWSEELLKGDAVLSVEHIKALGPALGKHVDLIELEGALHDVFLSPGPVRHRAYELTLSWIARHLQ